jgi:UDP-arabinose 4-epimerase
MKVLVTGGAGYIGSHTCKALVRAGHEPVIFDNLSTGFRVLAKYGTFVHGDLGDPASIRRAMARHRPEAVIHFAASAYVGVSVREPRFYYRNNVAGTLNLLDAMLESGIGRLVFSSSCATYGEPETMPIQETTPQAPINPYGQTKLICEQMARAVCTAETFDCVALRYFNAAGADREGDLGELHDPETHLIPLILDAIADPARPFTIFGDDYPTPDGTCIRDYLHVEDLASAHLLALEQPGSGFRAYNLGTGNGYSVRQVVEVAERVTGRKLNAGIVPRRPGDPPELVADASLARAELGWEPKVSDLPTILETAWRWHQSRPA